MDGTPVKCMISPCTIGGAETASCAEFFAAQNICASLAVTPCVMCLKKKFIVRRYGLSFSADDAGAADFAACKKYDPIYR